MKLVCSGFRVLACIVMIASIGCHSQQAGSGAAVVAFQHRPGKLHITIGGAPFATYYYQDPKIPRPYFAHVKTPSGIQVTRNHPPNPEVDDTDHATFHPGIWLTFADINGNDYWRLKAKVEHEMFLGEPKVGPGRGTFTVRNYYLNAADNTRMVLEICRYTILALPNCYMLISDSTFSSEEGDFYFGDQEEFGLGIRVATPIAERYGGQILNADGLKGAEQTWGKQSDWCDYSGVIDDTRVGMMIMPDPGNFRRSWYHARNYGFIAANPFGRNAMKAGEPSKVVVKKGEKFRLGFGVAIYSAQKGANINRNVMYEQYLREVCADK